VKLLGEGAFHQIHGGITTNTTAGELALELVKYKKQFAELRGEVPVGLPKNFYFLGALRHRAWRARMSG
jgi:hypothetical protein